MTKKPVHTPTYKPPMPFVSVCTPTFNRRPFIPILFECFRNQKYPKHRIEWIIIDDGTDKIKDLVDQSKIPQIKYFPIEEKMTLGAKRNMMNDKAKGSIIVYMDDDDYYPPERIIHAVETLQANPRALCAGTSEVYLYFKHIQKMYQFGPYNQNHATAATFAFRRELLNITRYDDNACIAEEKIFLKDYTIPLVQLDPMKTILVFSHEHNSFDKRTLLNKINPNFVKESPKTVNMFIRNASEASIKKFFMEDIDQLLANYSPGLPILKQDVLTQMKEIDEERQRQKKQLIQEQIQKLQQQQQQQQQQQDVQQIMMQEPGKEPVPIGIVDAVNIINKQQQQIHQDALRIKELEEKLASITKSPPKTVSFTEGESIILAKGKAALTEVAKLREKVQELENQLKQYKISDSVKTKPPEKKSCSKTEPEIKLQEISQQSPSNSLQEKISKKEIKEKSKSEPEIKLQEISQPPPSNSLQEKISKKEIKEKSKTEPEIKLSDISSPSKSLQKKISNKEIKEKSKSEPEIKIGIN